MAELAREVSERNWGGRGRERINYERGWDGAAEERKEKLVEAEQSRR